MERFEGKAFYLGDIHAHSGASLDGASTDLGECTGECGSLEGISETAKGNGLDFLALTDHVNGPFSSIAPDYLAGLEQIAAGNDPETGFITIPGAELMFKREGADINLGHKTLLMFGEPEALADLTIEDVRPGATTDS